MAIPRPKIPRIKVTKDYGLFVFTDENRQIQPPQVQAVGREIDRKNLNNIDPIKVRPLDSKLKNTNHPNGRHIITDGQHTFLALKERNEWVFYIESETFDIDDIPRYNSLPKSWTFDDYMGHWCQREIRDYQIYAGFKNRSGWSHTNLMLMLSKNIKGTLNNFKTGQFKITMNINTANEYVDMVNDFAEYVVFFKNRNFIKACLRMFQVDDYDHKRMMAKMDYQSERVHKQIYWEDYLRQLEDVYNYKSVGHKIRFF